MYCFSTFDMIKKLREETSLMKGRKLKERKALKKNNENNNLLCLSIQEMHLRMYHKLLV